MPQPPQLRVGRALDVAVGRPVDLLFSQIGQPSLFPNAMSAGSLRLEEAGVVAGELGDGPRLAPAQGAHGVGYPFLGALAENPEPRDDLARDELRYPGPHEGLPRHIVGHANEPDAPARHGRELLGDALEGDRL